MTLTLPISPSPQAVTHNTTTDLKQAAIELEITFMAQMLEAAGLGKTSTSFGGPGEAQFASLLVTEQARSMVNSGGIGLAEMIYDALKEHQNENQ